MNIWCGLCWGTFESADAYAAHRPDARDRCLAGQPDEPDEEEGTMTQRADEREAVR